MNWFQRTRSSARAFLLLLCALCGLNGLNGLAWAQLAVPNLTGHVVDTTGTLSASAAAQLDAQLSTFEQQQGTQLVLLLVPTTQPEDIVSYANRVANTWKIGRKEIGDGLLLVVATQDRKVRIEVAKTLEGAIPDLAAKRVIDERITPRFKQGDYAGGLDAGVQQLMALVRGEKLPPPQRAAKDSRQINTDFEWADLAVFLFLVVPVVAGTARRIFGAKAGALATGVAAGGLALLFTASLVVAVLTATLGSALSGASTPLIKRAITRMEPLAITAGMHLIAFIVLLPGALVDWPESRFTAGPLGAVAVMGIATSGLAWWMYARLMRHVTPIAALSATFMITGFGVLWAVLFLGEQVGIGHYAGGAMILLACTLVTGFNPLRWRMPVKGRVAR
jgi:uncharacterized protein